MALPPGSDASAKVSPQDIWDALEQAGASPIQAAAIMGNMIAESGLNPESNAPDSNGYNAVGLVSWNLQSYPHADSLVTGHPAADLAAQVSYLASTGGFKAAAGSTVAQAASNFAANYERCQTCQPGGASNTTRQANAGQVAGWASSGGWPTSAGDATDTATLTSAGTAQDSATCAWQLSIGLGSVLGIGLGNTSGCVLSKSQLRAIEGASWLAAGGCMMAFGIALLTGQSNAVRRTVRAGARFAGA